MNDIKKTDKPSYIRKYNSKYFGIATGVMALILFLLIMINSSFSNINSIKLLKPLIPFWNGISFFGIFGGIFISFLWGWLLGYFFILFYNFFDSRFSQTNH